MGLGNSTGGFGRSCQGEGAVREIIAMIQDIKTAPALGQKRLVIREKGMVRSHAVIDIDTKHSHEVEKNGTYAFKVQKKTEDHNGQSTRKMTSGFKAYQCSARPEKYTSETEHAAPFNRFSGGSNMQSKNRTKF